MDRHAGSTDATLVGRATTLLVAAGLATTTLVTVVAAAVTAVVMTAAVTVAAVVVATPPPAGAATASGAGGAALTLASQTPWVGPGQSLTLRLGTRSSVAVADQALDVAVYPCLGSVSAFDQALSSPSGTPVAATHQPLALRPLLQDGVATLSMPVTAGRSASNPSGSGSGSGFAISLPDEPGQCGASPSGVYPVRVELVDTRSDTTLGSLTTFLVFDDTTGPSAHRLMVAVTLPVQATVAPAPHPSSSDLRATPSAALTPPSAARQRALAATVAQLAGHPGVPVTVETSGQTLAGSGGAGATPARLAAATGNDALTTTTYAPVDVTDLTGAGLTGELVLQLARGAQVAAGLTQGTAAGGSTTWVAHTPPTQAALDALAGAGVRQVVVPASSVAEAPTDGSTARPFTVTGGSTTMTAVAANGDLSQRMASAGSSPALAAQELVAEATQMYFEKPNDTTARGVVAAGPAGWTAPAPFVAALLAALDGNPLLQPVTVPTLATTVPVDEACRTCRLTNVSSSGGGLPAGAIRVQRARVAELGTATVDAPTLAPALGDVVLAGESDLLRAAQQRHVLANASKAVTAQLDQVSVSGERTITLTSQQGTLPVTIVSNAPYSIRATLSLASDKLLFDNRQTSWTVPGPVTLLGHGHNNVVLVPVETRTPGLFTVDITLRAPSGGLEVASGQITVRSSATSIVGIVLSVAALVVLAVWWIRTSRRRRAQRRADEAGLAP